MAIVKNYGWFTPECDCCGETLGERDGFSSAVDAEKAAGWKRVKESWGWQDYCPECYQKTLWQDE